MDALPKLDRAEFRERMREAVENVINEVADAVDGAPRGRVIAECQSAG